MINGAFLNFLSSALVGVDGASQQGPSFWFPAQASNWASDVDWVFNFIFYISLVFFVIILAVMFGFVWKYRVRPGVEPQESMQHNTFLELAWSVLPSILLGFMFYYGVTTYVGMRTPPDEAYEIQVLARKFSWSFTYPNGYTGPELHVPVHKPVRLVIASDDVLHSLFIPAFRTKMDAVPGRYTKIWFSATQLGEYQIFCAEYCGTSHSDMLSKVVVHEEADFKKWLAEAGDVFKGKTLAEVGGILYTSQGCNACHSVDGTPRVGPTWKGSYGAERKILGGAPVVIDENYIRESVMEPMTKIAEGFAPAMPSYKGRLTDKEITALIEYIKTLK